MPAVDLGDDPYKKAAADLPAHTKLKGMTLPGTSVLLDGAGRPRSYRGCNNWAGRPQRAERLSLGCGRCRSLSRRPHQASGTSRDGQPKPLSEVTYY